MKKNLKKGVDKDKVIGYKHTHRRGRERKLRSYRRE